MNTPEQQLFLVNFILLPFSVSRCPRLKNDAKITTLLHELYVSGYSSEHSASSVPVFNASEALSFEL